VVFSQEPELSEVLIGNGRIKMEEMGAEAKLMRSKIGLLLVLALLPMLFGTIMPRIYIELVLKEWFVFLSFYFYN
jgi:hypothetical protein